MLAALFLLLALAFVGALAALLFRPGAARAGTVWGLAAGLPLLAALAGAFAGETRAARTLQGDAPPSFPVVLVHGAARTRLTLAPSDAACVERALRLGVPSELRTSGPTLRLTPETRVEGTLPPREVVEALTLRGLKCPHVRALPAEG
ncbi:hypothetical protein RDMS_13680 [Deinococcus sp. RL]|uniref:hypothetical protein n=1 Tax=Deinococcus sp. RL TaxID=1489678 RepID=UPI0004D41774|nr:hypothetical protein [Deinococcus sp. RL]KEF33239.1 hypothetical protein RDMS_13680 [Deinococcus sp. RL]